MKKLDVRLIRMIKHSKGQFISIIAIVAAALCIYILFSITTLNINGAVDDYYRITNVNDIQVQLVTLPQSALKELYSIEGVEAVQGRLSFDVPLKVANKDEKATIRLITIPADGEKINKLFRFGRSSGTVRDTSAIVLQQFAAARGIEVGDVITPYLNGREYPLTVSGIAASAEYIYLMENEQALLPNPEKFGVAFVSEKFAQSIYGSSGHYNEVLITLKDKSKIDDVVDAVEEQLNPYGVKRITKLEDQLSNYVLVAKMEGIEKMSTVMPIMFLMVGGIIIVIMLTRLVSNDRTAIGVLKALGYGNRQVLMHYTKYVLLMGLTGGLVGIVGGYLLAGPLSEVFVFYFNIPFVTPKFYPLYTINALLMTSVFCMASGLLGARGVLKIMPADAMRPESPKSGKRIMLERIGFIWRRIAFSWKMVIRNIMRTKKRFVFLTFGLAMAYAINVVPLYMGESMPTMFKLQYNVYQTMDYNVDFSKPMNESIILDLKHLVDASQIEPRIETPFELSNGLYKTGVILVGVSPQSQFFHFYDTHEQKVYLQSGGIFLTESLARTLHVNKGDIIRVKNYIPGKEDIHVKVNAIVRQYMGSNAYMDISTMQNLLLNKQMITGVSMASSDDVKAKLESATHVSSVKSTADLKNSFLEYLDTIMVATNAYMIFGGILGFAIVYNSTVIGISERKMEFSSLRVMGFDKKDVFKIVTRENIVLAACAIGLGIPLGIGMIQAMAVSFSSEMISFPIIYPPRIFIIAAIATGVFVLLAQLAARKKIYQLDFIDALKSRIS